MHTCIPRMHTPTYLCVCLVWLNFVTVYVQTCDIATSWHRPKGMWACVWRSLSCSQSPQPADNHFKGDRSAEVNSHRPLSTLHFSSPLVSSAFSSLLLSLQDVASSLLSLIQGWLFFPNEFCGFFWSVLFPKSRLQIYGGYFIIIITAQVAAPVMQDNCLVENREKDGPIEFKATTC